MRAQLFLDIFVALYMRKVRILVLVALFLPFIGCQVNSVRRSIQCITPAQNSGSFFAIVRVDSLVTDSLKTDSLKKIGISKKIGKFIGYQTLFKVDSLGAMKSIANLDTKFNYYKKWILDDSTILYSSYEDSAVLLYHVQSKSKTELLKGFIMTSLASDAIMSASNDGLYFVVMRSDRKSRERTAYRFQNDHITKVGSAILPEFTSLTYSDHNFYLLKENRSHSDSLLVLSEDFTVKDSAIFPPGTIRYDSAVYLDFIINYDKIRAEKKPHIMIFTTSHFNQRSSFVGRYDFITKQVDTLFTGMYFEDAIPLRGTGNYLIQGKTKSEYEEEAAMIKKTGISDAWPLPGYWMIGNTKTKKLKKIGYGEYSFPIFSSDGKYILFHTYKENDFEVNIESLQTLLDCL